MVQVKTTEMPPAISSTPMQISIDLPSDLEKVFQQVPAAERKHFIVRAIRGQLHQDQLNNPKNTLNDIAKIISQRARKRGLDEAKLDNLLADEK